MRGATLALAASLIVPTALLALIAAGNGRSLLTDGIVNFLWNWGYMAAPFLLFAAVQCARSMRHLVITTVILLCAALIGFAGWVWWFVVPRESALAWVLYIPLWAILLTGAMLASWLIGRRKGSAWNS
jgi:hypothetical protein